jgi:hypothetical protein
MDSPSRICGQLTSADIAQEKQHQKAISMIPIFIINRPAFCVDYKKHVY